MILGPWLGPGAPPTLACMASTLRRIPGTPSRAARLLAVAALPLLAAQAEARPQDLLDSGGTSYLRPDDEPPVGVLGAAAAAAGDLTLTWNWESIERSGVRVGSEEGSLTDAVGDPRRAAAGVTSARAEEHRFGVHFELREGLDLDLVLPYRDARLVAQDPDAGPLRQRANGLGDLEIGALWTRPSEDSEALTYGLALALPTGSTDEKGRTNGGDDAQLPYFIQPGNGAWSLTPRAYVVGKTEEWSWGYGGHYTARVAVGGQDWHKGNELELGAWASNRINRDTSISLRLEGRHADGVSGRDAKIEAVDEVSGLTATNFHDAGNTGGTLLRMFAGLNYVGTRGNRFAVEIGVPLHEDVRGVQVSTGMTYGLGWRYSF